MYVCDSVLVDLNLFAILACFVIVYTRVCVCVCVCVHACAYFVCVVFVYCVCCVRLLCVLYA